jgi:hypothetical protein
MSFEIAAVTSNLGAAGAGASAGAASPGSADPTVQVGYGASLTDFGGFERALARLEARPLEGPSAAAKHFMKPFEHINNEAAQISADAQVAKAEGREMTPGEIVSMTVRCQEFMFHCQLVSNIANRTSDGLQQLFRQQS